VAVKDASPQHQLRTVHAVLVAAISCAVLALVTLTVLIIGARPRPLQVRHLTQLTHDGKNKTALYVLDQTYVIVHYLDLDATLDLTTGITSPSRFPEYTILSVSPQRREALAVRLADAGAPEGLWLVPLRGGRPRRIGAIDVNTAEWSPSGQQIAFGYGPGLYVASSDGAVQKTLATFSGQPAYPAWSPDGERIRFSLAFVADRTATSELWEVRADGSGLIRVIENRSSSPWDAGGQWTPDGRDYIFESTRSGMMSLWSLSEGTGWFQSPTPVQLTKGPIEFSVARPVNERRWVAIGRPFEGRMVRYDPTTRALTPYAGGIPAWQVDFSPDARRIAYVKHPEKTLWLADADGTGRRQLSAPGFVVESCSWSPDRRWIAMRAQEPGHQHHKVYVIPVEGGTAEPLSPGDVEQGMPTWSADSSRVTFGDVPGKHAESAGNESIHIVEVRSHHVETLAGSDGLWTSRWSPDGRYVAALTIDAQELRLFDLTNRTWRSMGINHIEDPTWSRDGKYIYFTRDNHVDYAVSRIEISDGAVERLFDLKGDPDRWSGVAPDNSILLLGGRSNEIYMFDLER